MAVTEPVAAPEESPPETAPGPRRGRPWWRFLFPWPRGRTRNAAPADDDALLVDNRTAEVWALHLGYRDLGTVPPHQRRRERVVKTGMLTARVVDAPVGTGYLTAWLTPSVRAVEIRGEPMRGQPLYELRLT